MKTRRDVMSLLAGGAAAAWPLAARAQLRERMRRVGLLMGYPEGDFEGQASAAAFQRRLEELGWTEGRNIQIDTRWAGADPDKARAFAKELVAIKPDVIVPSTNLVTAILQQETLTIPIVFVLVGDPVGSGFVATMARPGGSLTGFSVFEPAIGGKWLEIFKEIAPNISRVGFILHPETPVNAGFLRAAEAAAPSLGVKIIALGVHTAAEIERAITEFAGDSNGGLIVAPHAVTVGNRERKTRSAIVPSATHWPRAGQLKVERAVSFHKRLSPHLQFVGQTAISFSKRTTWRMRQRAPRPTSTRDS
jgi:putative ABC transport system substrate-binding protein